MLYLVLLLVMGSLGLLLAALRGGGTILAWASVGVSVIAALLLLFDWAGRRLAADAKQSPGATPDELDRLGEDGSAAAMRAPQPAERSAERHGAQDHQQEHPPAPTDADAASESAPAAAAAANAEPGPSAEQPPARPGRHLAVDGGSPPPSTAQRPGYRPPGRTAPAGAPRSTPVSLNPAIEPPEEDTDAADSLRVAELSDEVRVLDERPRYHLAGCEWVGDRFTLALPVHEARELGFSPCALCQPDSVLCTRHRHRSSAG